jgi:hypothetical protein
MDNFPDPFLATVTAYQLIEQWAEIFSKKPLISPDGLSVKQKDLSFLEQTTKPPRLIRDTGFLGELEKHYEALLTAPLCLSGNDDEPTSMPSLSVVRQSLAVEKILLLAWAPPLERSEEDTSAYHRKLLDPLCRLARVCMAEGGATLTRSSAETLDDRLQSLHPTVVTRTHKGSSGSGSTKPDHTIASEHAGASMTLMCIEDKNTSFGTSKWEALEERVEEGSVDAISDEGKVWKQVIPLKHSLK